MSFRLLTELYSFLLEYHMTMKDTMNEEFPSPYGVSFILIKNVKCIKSRDRVSVSLWSIIHSYRSKMKKLLNVSNHVFPSPYRVIFILTSFNLYYYWYWMLFPSPYGVIFILTLWSKPSYDYEDIMEFPSSYGVSFIIIWTKKMSYS